jgi:ABC-type polysaccharide/polyol phosphate export permease
MRFLTQVIASFQRSMRIFLRDKAVIGSSMVSPLFFLIVLPVLLFQNMPAEALPIMRGYLVISMCTFMIMITAISNLPGSIAADRDHDLYSKLSSMPISPVSECIGRILTVLSFSGLGTVIVGGIGIALGAQLFVSATDLVLILGVGCVTVLAASGVGLVVAALAKSESAAAHVGLAIVMVTYFIGIAFPYADLPPLLQPLARFNPLSLANSMMATLALGGNMGGFNPLNLYDGAFLISASGLLFLIGLYLYSQRCWRR